MIYIQYKKKSCFKPNKGLEKRRQLWVGEWKISEKLIKPVCSKYYNEFLEEDNQNKDFEGGNKRFRAKLAQ